MDENSPWRAAWYDGIEQATVTVLALPLGDLGGHGAAAPAEASWPGITRRWMRWPAATVRDVFVTTASVEPAADVPNPAGST